MLYNCIIADDHLVERDLMKLFVSKINNLNLVAVCENGMDVFDQLQKTPIDIVISDVDMPELSGIDLVKSLKNPPVFIFISSYPEYAAEGFNLDIIDFIVKPLQFNRFLKSINKAIEYIELKKKADPAPNIAEQVTDGKDFFFIKDQKGFAKINITDVLYIESMGDFSRIHTAQNKSYIILVGMKNLESQLPAEKFFRVHKQFIVNLQHISSVTQSHILLTDELEIPVSNSYKQSFQDLVIQKNLLTRN